MMDQGDTGAIPAAIQSVGPREPSQDRARISRDRILTATRELIMELGHDDLTLNDISARSGISVGSISFRFGAKENLFREVHIHALHLHLAQIGDRSEKVRDAGPLSHVIAGLVARSSRIFRQNAAFLTAASDRGRRDPDIALLALTVAQKSREAILSRLRPCVNEIEGASPDDKAEFVAKTIVDVFLRRAHSLTGEAADSRADTQLTAMCLTYLKATTS